MTDLHKEYEVSVDDEIASYVDKPDPFTEADYAGGTEEQYVEDAPARIISELWAHPDQSQVGKLMGAIRTAVQQELDRERKIYQNLIESSVRVTTNLSGQILFSRYTVQTGFAIQICREKSMRGDIVVVNFTDPSIVYIGLHPGIIAGGTDTGSIVGSTTGTARRMRTRRALWAIASAPATIDVQEEFD